MSYPGHSLWGCLTALQRSSRCILQPQQTEQSNIWDLGSDYTKNSRIYMTIICTLVKKDYFYFAPFAHIVCSWKHMYEFLLLRHGCVSFFFSKEITKMVQNEFLLLSYREIGEIRINYIGLSRVFANCPGARSSIPSRVIPKTKKKMVLDAALLNTQHYKVRIKCKMEQ